MVFTDDTAPCSSMHSLTTTSANSPIAAPLTLIAGIAPDRLDTAVADTSGVILGPAAGGRGAVCGGVAGGGSLTGGGAAGGLGTGALGAATLGAGTLGAG